MKNILLLTDFSPKSENAHQYAFNYFTGQACTFHLLSIQKVWEYTTDDLILSGSGSSLDTALLGDNKSQVKTLIKSYSKRYKDSQFKFEGHVDYNIFTDAVSHAVKNYHIELIVCGTDGETGIVEKIFSSHTLRIIRAVNCPVLVIPAMYKFQKPDSLQYILDYDDVFEMCGKEQLIELARKYRSHLQILRLTFGYDVKSKEFDKEHLEIKKLFPSNTVTYYTFYDNDPIKFIEEMLVKEPCQLQVLSAKRQTFLERIFSNSHLSKVVNSVRVPLLILRDCNS